MKLSCKENKLLFIARSSPLSEKGGDMFVLKNTTKALTESGISCDLLCYSAKKQYLSPETFFENIYFTEKEPKFNLRCIFQWIFTQKSYLFNRFYSKKLSEKLLELVKTGEYSMLVFEHAYMYANLLYNSELIEEVKKNKIKTILNMHVLESFVFEQIYKQNPLFRREVALQKKAETECIKHADRTVFLSKEELERVENRLPEAKNKLGFLPMMPFIENYPYSQPEFEEKNSIYFLGTYSWIQNSDAVKYFVKEIFPLILRQNPSVKFYLIGMNAGKDIKSLHDGKNIFFVGEVENIFEEIKKYSVLVVPLRIKGGTRIKIAEALCFGKAIVSTSAGMEGIVEETENKPVIIADEPLDFAQKVLALLCDEQLRQKTKENAVTFAERHYSFEKFQKIIIQELMLELL